VKEAAWYAASAAVLLILCAVQAGRSAGGDKGKGKFSEKDVAMADVD